MNIKYIKALAEAKVYPDTFQASEVLTEDMEIKERSMPYHFYPIPGTQDLIRMLVGFGKLKIESESAEDMGFIGHTVIIDMKVPGYVDTEETIKKFSSPILKDALAEALLAWKKLQDDVVEAESRPKG